MDLHRHPDSKDALVRSVTVESPASGERAADGNAGGTHVAFVVFPNLLVHNSPETEQPRRLEELLALQEPPQRFWRVEEELCLRREREERRQLWKQASRTSSRSSQRPNSLTLIEQIEGVVGLTLSDVVLPRVTLYARALCAGGGVDVPDRG